MSETPPPGQQLLRAIGRWSLLALTINSVIGSGIFGLPSVIAGLIGRSSPLAIVLAGAAMGVIIGCYAEVASRFEEAGGPYLYARAAFGRFMGIQTAWMLCLGQVAAPAANANLFVIYLAEFWPRVKDPVPRFLILTLLVGFLTFINYRGVRAGARASNIFTAAKLLPLFAIIIIGMTLVHSQPVMAGNLPSTNLSTWLKAMLLLVFTYGGFETALAPMSEAENPRRDVPFALFGALLTCTLIYALIQWVVVATLPDPAHSERPISDVARLALGHVGAGLVTTGALISFYGYLSAKILAMPRVPFALAEQGDFPRAFAAVHPRFKTPYVSLLVLTLLIWGFALTGEFKWNLTLSATARLFYYAVGCAALPVLRRKQPANAVFRLPGGNFLAPLGIAMCLVLVTRVDFGQSLIVLATIVIGVLNWILVRNQPVGN